MTFHGASAHMTVHISPENVPRFLELFRPVFEKVTQEPECIFLQLFQSPDDPGTISWVENWSKPKEWFMEHQMSKSYYDEYRAETSKMYLKPIEVRVFDLMGPEYTFVRA
ncbi:hypothetical protein BJY04DRAFT_203879 [Aspergillus karnatakaensis]|uniref:putative quinol monooxygenase n=1 Tax=Aspergillus karnatakaensis TaxID=1810916 RepID=UPI003CCD5950